MVLNNLNYEIKNKTYISKHFENLKDKIEVEVGDLKQEDNFYPQVKIKRWDNECNFSVRLLKDIQGGKDSQKDNKIEWVGKDKKASFYEIEDGFEFEVILDKKPNTNIFKYTLEDKDVDFYYQPELTKEEIEKGAIRADEVIGSYAIYAKTPKTNYVNGKEYKTGKVGHIYRPYANDSEGNMVWCDLNIKNGVLEITVPQDFLDKAVYPVIIDPTFGYTSAGASTAWFLDNDAYGIEYNMPDTANATSISVYCYSNAISENESALKGVIWSSDKSILTNGITQGNYIPLSTDPPNPTPAWETFDFNTSPSLSASTTYILGAVIYDPFGVLNVLYDTAPITRYFDDMEGNNYATPQALSASAQTGNYQKLSLYCTYEGTETYTGTIQTKASIKKLNQTKTLSSKSRIKGTGITESVQAKAKIQYTRTETIETKTRIQKTNLSTSTSRARIKQEQSKSVITRSTVKQLNNEQIIEAKSRIQQLNSETIESKARVKGSGTENNISAQAKISVGITKTVLVSPESETSTDTPIQFVWEIPESSLDLNIHSQIQVARDSNFEDIEKDLNSLSENGFEYFNGSEWVDYPLNGVSSEYYGNQARISLDLSTGLKYWRVRGGAG